MLSRATSINTRAARLPRARVPPHASTHARAPRSSRRSSARLTVLASASATPPSSSAPILRATFGGVCNLGHTGLPLAPFGRLGETQLFPFVASMLSHAASRKTRAACLYRRQAGLQQLPTRCARLRSACSGLSRLRRLRLPALAALRQIVSKGEPLQACVHSLRRKITRKTHSLTLVRLAR